MVEATETERQAGAARDRALAEWESMLRRVAKQFGAETNALGADQPNTEVLVHAARGTQPVESAEHAYRAAEQRFTEARRVRNRIEMEAEGRRRREAIRAQQAMQEARAAARGNGHRVP